MLRRKNGFATVATLILIFTVLPLLVFAVVDLPFWLTANRRFQNIVDNATSNASTALVESSLANGIIEFDEAKAEQILFTEIQDFFEVGDIPAIPDANYVLLSLNENAHSYFQLAPVIMRLQPGVKVDLTNIPYGTPIIEYIIYNPVDHPVVKTYYLSNGESVVLYKPTIMLSIQTKVYAPTKLYPINLHKISTREVTIGQN